MRPFKFPRALVTHHHVLRRLVFVGVLGSACAATLLWSPELATWREQWRERLKTQLRQPSAWNLQNLAANFSSLGSPSSPAPRPHLTDTMLLTAAQELRTEANLPELQENTTLKRLARLIALEAEDTQSLSVPEETSEIMRRLTPTPPRNVEVILFFAPKNAPELELRTQLASSSALLTARTTEIGIATRSASLDDVPGTLGIVTIASTFPSEPTVNAQPRSAPRPSFTGQDLWQAVQNYRKAHSLPTFEQSNELCTVASIRVNELLELGKLDNHDGFQKRADEFFERNKGWSSINENIASGYQTAVQTVEWGWDQSLGHQALIQSREYPKACAAANSGFSVLVTGK